MARGDITSFTLESEGALRLLNHLYYRAGYNYFIQIGYSLTPSGAYVHTPEQSVNGFRTLANSSSGFIFGGFLITTPIPNGAYVRQIRIRRAIGAGASEVVLQINLTDDDRVIFTEESLLYIEKIEIKAQGY